VSITYRAITTIKDHSNNDDIIIGFNFEVAVEGKRYSMHHGHGMLSHRYSQGLSEYAEKWTRYTLPKKVQPAPVGRMIKNYHSLYGQQIFT
jgi:hypothetical protein